jgi:hypothetical protein
MSAETRPAIVVARDIEQALKDRSACTPEMRRLLAEAAKVLSKIPNHRELIPQAVTFSVAEVAVWLNWMPHGEPVKSKVYNAATERVRGLIRRGELVSRATGGKSYSISGFALWEYMERRDEPIRARDAA